MMGQPAGVRIWLAAGVTDLRKGFEGLSALVQTSLGLSPYSGQIFVFRGRRGDRIKILWDTQDGLCLFYGGDSRVGCSAATLHCPLTKS